MCSAVVLILGFSFDMTPVAVSVRHRPVATPYHTKPPPPRKVWVVLSLRVFPMLSRMCEIRGYGEPTIPI